MRVRCAIRPSGKACGVRFISLRRHLDLTTRTGKLMFPRPRRDGEFVRKLIQVKMTL